MRAQAPDLTVAVQDYLKAVYQLGEAAEADGPITTSQVADALAVTTAVPDGSRNACLRNGRGESRRRISRLPSQEGDSELWRARSTSRSSE